MDYWEFLIQQEGDQTWLPLENKQVEILEGRYRVAVHTSLASTPVDVRVSQLILTEMPPRRRVRKRKGQTNESGLLVIFPYMQLSPGRWEIHCSGTDVLSDFMGAGWERAVQLEVVPYEEDAWDPSWKTDSHRGDGEDGADRYPADSTIESVNEANYSPSGLGAPPSSDAIAPPPLAIEVAADSTYGIQLSRQALVAQPGRTLFLEGEIFSLAGEALPESELSVQLRDPQTAQVLMETRQHLPAQSLPAQLAVDLKLQPNLKTRVVLGAVAVRAQVSKGAALASAAFTITAGLHDLLDAIANQTSSLFEEEISIYPGSTEPFAPAPEPPETLIAPELPLSLPVHRRSVPSEGLTLPPQLHDPDEADGVETPDRPPELPKLPERVDPLANILEQEPWDEPMPAELAPESVSSESDVAADAAPPADEFAAIYQQANPTDEPIDDPVAVSVGEGAPAEASPPNDSVDNGAPARFESSTIEDEDLDAELAAAVLTDEDDDYDDFEPPDELDELDADRLDEASPVSYVEASFRSLNLQERFWDRLTSLTYDGHQAAAKLRNEMAAAGVSTAAPPPAPAEPPVPTEPVPVASPPVPPPATDEVVVYDDPPAVIATDLSRSARGENAADQSPLEKAEPVTIAPPKIDVPEQDLVAGELVSIRLRLQKAEQYRPYAKVWMNDRQTRTLIEEPRLVMHFTPNSFGELETLMRIKVPLGCLELQIAAIAIDMSTLQESSRAVVNRHVIPPDLPASGLDSFDL